MRKELTREQRRKLVNMEVGQFEEILLTNLVTQVYNPKIKSVPELVECLQKKTEELVFIHPTKKSFIIRAKYTVKERIKDTIEQFKDLRFAP